MKESYLLFCLFQQLGSKAFRANAVDKWIPKDEMLGLFQSAMRDGMAQYGIRSGSVYDDLAARLVDNFLGEGVITTEGDKYSGEFFKISDAGRNNYVSYFVTNDEVAQRIKNLGIDILATALARIAEEDGLASLEGTSDTKDHVALHVAAMPQVPAADRLVSLSHNEQSEFDERTSEIIDAVDDLNVIEGAPGFREVIIGQLKAGRELIRAGSFKAYLIELTLIETLQFLAKRYEKEMIGGLAAALALALLKHIGVDV